MPDLDHVHDQTTGRPISTPPGYTPPSGGSSAGDYRDQANWTGLNVTLSADQRNLVLADYIPGDSDSSGTRVPAMATDGTYTLPEGLYRVTWFMQAHADTPPSASAAQLSGGVSPLGNGNRRIHTGVTRNDVADGTISTFIASDEWLIAVPSDGLTLGPLFAFDGDNSGLLTLDNAEFMVCRVA